MTDVELLVLVEPIASFDELKKLGDNVLKPQRNLIETAEKRWSNDITYATYYVLKTWYNLQTNEKEACANLLTAPQISYLADELRKSVDRTENVSWKDDESEYQP